MVQQVDPGDQAEELVAVEDDGDVAGVEDRQQVLHRPVDLHGLQAAGHGGLDLVLEVRLVARDGEQDVAFVDDADDVRLVAQDR